jgi:hypothetical protein
MRALWSKAFSSVFYLKVNSTFQNCRRFLARFLRICSYFMFHSHEMTISFKVFATCMDTLLCEIYCQRVLAPFPSSFLVSRESSNLSTTYASVIYGNKKIQLKLRMRALWSKAFSLVFYLKVNSTFQNWTIIFVHLEISENSFKFPNKLLNYLIREKSKGRLDPVGLFSL